MEKSIFNKTRKYLVRSLLLLKDVRGLETPNFYKAVCKHFEREGLILIYNFKIQNNRDHINNLLCDLDWFVEDYLIGDPIYGVLHGYYFKIPDEIFLKFMTSEYSKMYTPEQLLKVSPRGVHPVLIKDPLDVKKLAEMFDTSVEFINELDSLIDVNEFYEHPVIANSLEIREWYKQRES